MKAKQLPKIKQLTAVEWLITQIVRDYCIVDMPRYDTARIMEKEQIINSFVDGRKSVIEEKYESFDDYYKEIYGERKFQTQNTKEK